MRPAHLNAWRCDILKLAHEIKYLHVFYADLLVFFGIEDAFLRWSTKCCEGGEVHHVRAELAEWREVLQQYSNRFPSSGGQFQSYTAMHNLLCEAQRAAKLVQAGFRVLDAHLAPHTVVTEGLENEALAA